MSVASVLSASNEGGPAFLAGVSARLVGQFSVSV